MEWYISLEFAILGLAFVGRCAGREKVVYISDESGLEVLADLCFAAVSSEVGVGYLDFFAGCRLEN